MNLEKQKENFKNHRAIFKDLGNIKILDFKKPNRLEMLFTLEKRKKVPIKGVDLGNVLENIHDEMYEEVGELAYDWTIEYPNHDKKKYLEYQEKLKQLVMDYLKEIGMEPGFFSGH